MTQPVKCRTCGSLNTSIFGRGARGRRFAGVDLHPTLDGGWLYRCADCGLLMRHPLLTVEEYGKLYSQSAGGHWTKADLRPEQRRIRDYLQKALPNGGSVLDVGCSSGDLLKSLGSGFRKFGIEPSAAARVGAQDVGVEVVSDTVEGLAACFLRFDAITAIDVFEHVANPLELLFRLAGHLKESGLILISTGNSDALAWRVCGPSYYYSHNFEHVSFISERWCDFAATQGFHVEVLEARFCHRSAEPESNLAFFWKRVLLGIKIVPAWFECTAMTRLPTLARSLGPRLMLGEPGMFNDHILAVFRPK